MLKLKNYQCSFILKGEDTGSDGPDEEREDGEANEAAEEEERERQRRIEESLRKREEEVQRALAGHLRDRDKERMQHKHDEAVHNFNALLADLVSLSPMYTVLYYICVEYLAKLYLSLIVIKPIMSLT